jgi:hypothetical protein
MIPLGDWVKGVCPVLVGIGACAMLCNNNTDLQLKA